MKNENLDHFLLHYNIYKEEWVAFPRSKFSDYFNGKLKPKELVRDKDVNKLIEKLNG